MQKAFWIVCEMTLDLGIISIALLTAAIWAGYFTGVLQ